MKGRCSNIFSYFIILSIAITVVPITEIQSLHSGHSGKDIFSEHIRVKGSLKIEDKSSGKDGGSEWKHLFKTSGDASLSTKMGLHPFQSMTNNSCSSAISESNGQQSFFSIIISEMFCEVKNLFGYIVVSLQNLKSEFRIDLIHIIFKIPYYVIQLKRHAISGDIIDSVKSHVTRLEVFLEDATNVKGLVEIVKRIVPIFDIVETLSRLKIIVRRFFLRIEDIFTSFEEYISLLKDIVKDLEFHISVIMEQITSFLYEYLSTRAEEARNTFLKVLVWLKTKFVNLIIRIEQRIHWFVAIVEEAIEILRIFRKGYIASGIFQAVIDVIFIFCHTCKPPLTYNMTLTCDTTPSSSECSCPETTPDFGDFLGSNNEHADSSTPESILAHLPIPLHGLGALKSNSSNLGADLANKDESNDEIPTSTSSILDSSLGSEHSTPFYRLLRSFPQNEKQIGANTGKDAPVLSKNSYHCGTSKSLPSFSSLNNMLKNASTRQMSLVIPKKEISSALGNESLTNNDTIVIFLGDDKGLIGLVKDSVNQIDFKMYKLKSSFTNAQNDVKIWHLRSNDFHNPSCELKFQLLFQN